MLDAAKRLQAGLGSAKGTGTVAVFYEPAGSAPQSLKYPEPPDEPKNGKVLTEAETKAREKASQKAWEEYSKKYEAAAKKAGEEDLRRQVREFLSWLKAQGVI